MKNLVRVAPGMFTLLAEYAKLKGLKSLKFPPFVSFPPLVHIKGELAKLAQFAPTR